MFRRAALLAGTHLARLATDIPALANDRHASLRRADLIVGAAVVITRAPGRAAAILCADASLTAAGVSALVLWWAAHIVDAAGRVIATQGTADG
jgi:hypothetical protein